MAISNSFKNVFSRLDLEMIPAKLTFFLADGYFGATMPFMNIFYVSIGLSTKQAGLISGISLLVSSVFNPLWSILADVTGCRKLIFTSMCLGSAATVFAMPWIELAVGKHDTITVCVNHTHINQTAHNVTTTDCHTKIHLQNSNVLFYVLLALNIVAWIFYTSLRCYAEGLVTNVVNTATKKRNFGTQRVFSTLGYAFVTFLTGIICDHYHPEGMSKYTAIFYVFLPCTLFLIPTGCVLIGQAKWEDDEEESEIVSSKGVAMQMLSAFKHADFIFFFLSVIVSGLTLNIFNCFFFLLMVDEMHSSNTLMTFAIVVSVICEMFVFAFSAKLIKLCGGTIPAFIIGLFSFFPRFMVMSYARNPWVNLAVQPLHGLGMGLSWAAAIDHTYKSFPKEITTTAIALMSSIEFIASSAVANMGGGVLYDKYGGRALFRSSGMFAALWCVFMTLYYGIRHHLAKKRTLRQSNQPSYTQGIVQDIDVDVPDHLRHV